MKLIHILPGLTRGGAEELLIQLIQHLPQHEHHVIFVYDGPLKPRFIEAGAHVHHIQGIFFSYDLFYFYHLIKKLRFLSPDCIHAVLWSSSIIARVVGKLLSIPVVCGMHARQIHDGMARILAQRCIPIKPFKFIAASKGIAKDLIEYHNIDAQNVCLIENGIYIPTQVQKTANPATVSLLAIGRFVPFKNFSVLLTIFKELVTFRPQVHLTIVGWGPQEDALRAQAQKLNVQEHVTFAVNESALSYLQKADIFVQPSWEEGLSIALLEALSYECAVIVSGKNQHHDIIEHNKHGFVINPQDSNEFISHAIQLIDDTSKRKQLGQAGKELVQNTFNIQTVALRYENIFQNATSHNRRF